MIKETPSRSNARGTMLVHDYVPLYVLIRNVAPNAREYHLGNLFGQDALVAHVAHHNPIESEVKISNLRLIMKHYALALVIDKFDSYKDWPNPKFS
ncbi:hypothetical protein Tco_0122321 [Tanacetum coccineum]